ncbi:hypothetical protein SEPCBS119000_000806 [Sporothrix epigloea]|uniref:Carbohydrate-binding module family 19 domain-containing protein n=1 Tax=Sporothrix epigloea TaxID=1892477 RepID=A0ABP0D897_9PEZI
MHRSIYFALIAASAAVEASPLGLYARSSAVTTSITTSTLAPKYANMARLAADSPQGKRSLGALESNSGFVTSPTSSPESSTPTTSSSSFMSLAVIPVNTSTLSDLLTSTPTGKANSAVPTAITESSITAATASSTATASLAASVYSANLARAKFYNSIFANLTHESRCLPYQVACIGGDVMECNTTTSLFAPLQICSPSSEMSCFAMPDPAEAGVDVGCVEIQSAKSILGDMPSSVSYQAPVATSAAVVPSTTVDITVTRTVFVTLPDARTKSPAITKPKETPTHHKKPTKPTHTSSVSVTATRPSATTDDNSSPKFRVPSTVVVIPVSSALPETPLRYTTVIDSMTEVYFKPEVVAASPAPTTGPSSGNADSHQDGDETGSGLAPEAPSTVTLVKTVRVYDTITVVSTTTATTTETDTATRTTTEASTTFTQVINLIG